MPDPLHNSVIRETGLEQKKILLAEDVQMNQFIAQHILQSWGCLVTIANNGKEAVALAEQHQFDCILMDVQMPETDGISATQSIRQLPDPCKSSVPIIALTANTLASDREKYAAAGMNDCIRKPILDSELFAVILNNLKCGNSSKDNNMTIPQQPTADAAILYDLSMVEAISGGSREFIQKMVALFIETVPPTVEALNDAVARTDWDQAGKLAHKLKSTVDSMGIRSIHQEIRTIESCTKQKNRLSEIPSLAAKVDEVIRQCIEQLNAAFP